MDSFDNSESRELVREYCELTDTPCMHVGLYADYGEVMWNTDYQVPQNVEGDVCEYPLARNLVMLASSVAAEVAVQFLATGKQTDWSITLGDFSIRGVEPVSVSSAKS